MVVVVVVVGCGGVVGGCGGGVVLGIWFASCVYFQTYFEKCMIFKLF